MQGRKSCKFGFWAKRRLLTCCGIASVLSNLLHTSVHKYCSHYCSLSIGHLAVSRPDSAPFLFLLHDLIRTASTRSSSKWQTSNEMPVPVKLQGTDVYWVCRRFSIEQTMNARFHPIQKCQTAAFCSLSVPILWPDSWRNMPGRSKWTLLSQNSWISFQLWSLAVRKYRSRRVNCCLRPQEVCRNDGPGCVNANLM